MNVKINNSQTIQVCESLYNNVKFHEAIHALDHKYYNENDGIHITIENITINSSESEKQRRAISEIKAILMETYYGDELIGGRLYELLKGLTQHNINKDFDRSILGPHDQGAYLVFKKIAELLSKKYNIKQPCASFNSLITFFQGGSTIDSLIQPLGLPTAYFEETSLMQRIFNKDIGTNFTENDRSTYQEFIADLRTHAFRDPEIKGELNEYIESLLDILYFGN